VTAPGDELNGRYRLQERLGSGSMGSVWKAYDKELGRTVAVKELLAEHHGLEDTTRRRERVRREALALAKVEHPAIVSIHDLISVGRDKNPWIVMGYVRGHSLDKLIAGGQGSALDEQKTASIGLAVLQGLTACHAAGVYHRDVKPANIVVSEDGSVRLVDFGIARIVGETSLTEESKVLGTPEFLAPELLNDQPAGPGTDLWALGVTLYYAVHGRAPFRAETLGALMAAILAKSPPVPRGGGPLGTLILQMLSKEPAARPPVSLVAATLRAVASAGGPATWPYWLGLDPGPDGHRAGGAGLTGQDPVWWDGARPERVRDQGDTVPLAYSGRRFTELSGMPAVTAARTVATWSADKAAADLLILGATEAAKIINKCDDPVGGKLLTAMAADRPAQASRILGMLTADRTAGLLEQMSSEAAAAVLAVLPAANAARRLAGADNETVVGVLAEMDPGRAAPIVQAMDEGRAAAVLGRMPDPVIAAAILAQVNPATSRQALLSRLPGPFRALVVRHL
jgi:flagellar motility protein MotE (MotC chaperone)/tRNA A-37 threonylcarbamoyl transferase component Bud32